MFPISGASLYSLGAGHIWDNSWSRIFYDLTGRRLRIFWCRGSIYWEMVEIALKNYKSSYNTYMNTYEFFSNLETYGRR